MSRVAAQTGEPGKPAASPGSRRAAAEATSAMLLLGLAAIMALLIGVIAFGAIRRRWIGSTAARAGNTRLPDPWRESARRLEQRGGGDSGRSPDEEPYQ